MEAVVHEIAGRHREFEVAPSSFADFDLGPGQPVTSRLALEPGWTTYCVDVERRQMLFVEIPPEVDLAEAPFVYVMQARLARRALIVPFAALEDLAERVPAPRQVIFVFNIARCGSTLVNAMLNRVEGVWSVSEPDPFFDLVMRRHLLDPSEIPGLVRACVLLSFRPPAARRAHTMGIKFRSESLFQAEHFHAAFPEAAYVFLYRDGVSWARSFWYFRRISGCRSCWREKASASHWWMLSAAAPLDRLLAYLDPDGPIPVTRVLAPGWAIQIEEYLRLRDRGLPFLAIRYNELQADQEAVTARLLRHCGLPAAAAAAAAKAFERDSQAGTAIARDRRDAIPFTEAEALAFREALARQPQVTSPDRDPAGRLFVGVAIRRRRIGRRRCIYPVMLTASADRAPSLMKRPIPPSLKACSSRSSALIETPLMVAVMALPRTRAATASVFSNSSGKLVSARTLVASSRTRTICRLPSRVRRTP